MPHQAHLIKVNVIFPKLFVLHIQVLEVRNRVKNAKVSRNLCWIKLFTDLLEQLDLFVCQLLAFLRIGDKSDTIIAEDIIVEFITIFGRLTQAGEELFGGPDLIIVIHHIIDLILAERLNQGTLMLAQDELAKKLSQPL